MASTQNHPVVRIAPNNPVFDLPVIVGIEEGLFTKAGLDVSFSATYADREKDRVEMTTRNFHLRPRRQRGSSISSSRKSGSRAANMPAMRRNSRAS